MNEITVLIIFILVQLIGGTLLLIKFIKDGTMENAARYGDGVRYADPAGVVGMCFTCWEIIVLLHLFELVDNKINSYYTNKYKE